MGKWTELVGLDTMKSENFSEWMKNPAYFATLSPTKNRAIS